MALSESEEKDLRIILESIFGFQDASRWNMNEKVLEVVAQMFQSASSCSEAINYLPRPGIIEKNYLKRQLRDIARRAVNGKRDIYSICSLTGTRIKWKPAIDIASQSL